MNQQYANDTCVFKHFHPHKYKFNVQKQNKGITEIIINLSTYLLQLQNITLEYTYDICNIFDLVKYKKKDNFFLKFLFTIHRAYNFLFQICNCDFYCLKKMVKKNIVLKARDYYNIIRLAEDDHRFGFRRYN